jgi:hypothetical protein
MIFGIKHSVTGTNLKIGGMSLDAAARGSNLGRGIPHRGFPTNPSRNTRLEDWTTPQITQLLPAVERFIPEFILVRGAM